MIVITGLIAHLIVTSPHPVITRTETVVACGIENFGPLRYHSPGDLTYV
jgi:hypothetical protein